MPPSETKPIEPADLAMQVVRAISAREPKWIAPHMGSKYTAGTKEILRRIGDGLGMRSVYRPGPPAILEAIGEPEDPRKPSGVRSEFMLDFVWLDKSGVGLAAEIEWAMGRTKATQRDDILYDFRKLMYVKSPLKLMICDYDEHVGGVVSLLESELAKYGRHMKGEQYAVLNTWCSEGRAYCHFWEADRDGRVDGENVLFRPVSDDFPVLWRKCRMPPEGSIPD